LARLLRRGRFRTFATELAATRLHLRQGWRQTLVRNVVIPLFRVRLFARWRRWREGLPPFGHTAPVSRQVLAMARRDGIAPRGAQGPRAGDSVTDRKLQLLR